MCEEEFSSRSTSERSRSIELLQNRLFRFSLVACSKHSRQFWIKFFAISNCSSELCLVWKSFGSRLVWRYFQHWTMHMTVQNHKIWVIHHYFCWCEVNLIHVRFTVDLNEYQLAVNYFAFSSKPLSATFCCSVPLVKQISFRYPQMWFSVLIKRVQIDIRWMGHFSSRHFYMPKNTIVLKI